MKPLITGHLFVPWSKDPRYCGSWLPSVTRGSVATGTVTLRSMCGYPLHEHPEVGCGVPSRLLTAHSWEWGWYPGTRVKHAINPMSGLVTECGLPGRHVFVIGFAQEIRPPTFANRLRPCRGCLRIIQPRIVDSVAAMERGEA